MELWGRIRKFFNDIHLWLGISSGIIIFLVCFSGTFLAFEHEIKDVFQENVVLDSNGSKKSLTELSERILKDRKGLVAAIRIPFDETQPYRFTVKKDASERRGTSVYVDPFSGEEVVMDKSSADGFMMFMFRLHRWLLLDSKIGRPIVGYATIIFLLLSVTGIVIWIPRKLKRSQFKAGLMIKTSASWRRINLDLHNAFGIYSVILLIILGITGLAWSFPWWRDGMSDAIGSRVFSRPNPELSVSDTADRVTADAIVSAANDKFNHKGDLLVSFPTENDPWYTIRKYHTESWAPVTYDAIYISQDGKVLHEDRFTDLGAGAKIASLNKPIHTGEIFGVFSKTLYFLVCLMATSLPITGTIIWINKLKKKGKNKLQPVVA